MTEEERRARGREHSDKQPRQRRVHERSSSASHDKMLGEIISGAEQESKAADRGLAEGQCGIIDRTAEVLKYPSSSLLVLLPGSS
ncbi:hypothetical protein GN956_G12906 [Arapaima gigas]